MAAPPMSSSSSRLVREAGRAERGLAREKKAESGPQHPEQEPRCPLAEHGGHDEAGRRQCQEWPERVARESPCQKRRGERNEDGGRRTRAEASESATPASEPEVGRTVDRGTSQVKPRCPGPYGIWVCPTAPQARRTPYILEIGMHIRSVRSVNTNQAVITPTAMESRSRPPRSCFLVIPVARWSCIVSLAATVAHSKHLELHHAFAWRATSGWDGAASTAWTVRSRSATCGAQSGFDSNWAFAGRSRAQADSTPA